MKINTEPRSDQWNAEDFIGTSRDFLIDHVTDGKAEAKYDVHLLGEQRVWRPPITVLRLLKKAWGDDSTTWHGRGVRLYNDESISFGKVRTGGIRVSHLSHIDGPVSANLSETRGRRKERVVEPMPTVDLLRAEYRTATPERRAAIEAEVAKLKDGGQ